VVGLLVFSGCGGGYSGPTGTVSGTVTLDGQPVPQGCAVSFLSVEGYGATGEVGADGSYQLEVIQGGGTSNDIPVAAYQVAVLPPEEPEMSEAEYEKAMEASGSDEAPVEEEAEEVIPWKYQAEDSSELTFEVKEGANTYDIKLTSETAAES
jgi:hypothetical protein